jgi:hypothetical protein
LQVPLEVTSVLREKGDTLTDKLNQYTESRADEWAAEHRRYLDATFQQGGDAKLQTFRHSLAAAYLGVPPRDSSVYDKRMLFLGRDHLLHVLTPLAQRAMIRLSDPDNEGLESVSFVTKEVFSDATGRYTGDVKGRVLEKYIIDMVSGTKLWTVGARCRRRKKLDMKVVISKKILFAGMGAPTQALDWEKSMLFEPHNSNYPAVDLLVWDATKKTLYAIQVTIQELRVHMKDTLEERKDKDDGARPSKWEELSSKWEAVLPHGSTVKLIWLANNDLVGDYDDEWIVHIQNLHSEFPLLACFKH